MTETHMDHARTTQDLPIDGDTYGRLISSLIARYKWCYARADATARLCVEAHLQSDVQQAGVMAHKSAGFLQLADECLLTMRELNARARFVMRRHSQ